MAELPQLLQLQESLSKDVAAIALNVDSDMDLSPDDATPKVDQTVAMFRGGVEHVLSLTASDQVLDHFGLFSLPAVVVIQNGDVVRRFEGEFTLLEDVLPFVKSTISD